MTKPSLTFKKYDVIVVPFPFTDSAATKKRPALVISNAGFNHSGRVICAMITTATHSDWPGDTQIENLKSAGLTSPCIVRMKLFTLDNRFIIKNIGTLAKKDRDSANAALSEVL
jgi:mRNA interferase MazF